MPDCFLVNRRAIPRYVCPFLSKKGLSRHVASLSCHQVCAANFGEFCSIVGQEATEKLLVRSLDCNPPKPYEKLNQCIYSSQTSKELHDMQCYILYIQLHLYWEDMVWFASIGSIKPSALYCKLESMLFLNFFVLEICFH